MQRGKVLSKQLRDAASPQVCKPSIDERQLPRVGGPSKLLFGAADTISVELAHYLYIITRRQCKLLPV